MVKVIAKICVGVAFLLGPVAAFSASYAVTVRNSKDPVRDIRGLCIPRTGGICDVNLGELEDLLGQPGWKQSLHDLGFDKVVVSFPDGSYRLNTPLKIKWNSNVGGVALELSGKNAHLLGSVPLSFKRVASAEGGFPESVWPHLWVAVVPRKFDRQPPTGFGMPVSPTSGELVYKNVAQPIASWPNTGFASIETASKSRKGVFSVLGRSASDWKDEPALRAFGFWFYDWSSQAYPVKYSAELGALEVIGGDVKYGIKSGQRIRIVNAIRELDVEGEWYLEGRSGNLYWWAPTGFDGNGGEYIVAESLMTIEDSSDVRVTGLSFDSSRGDAVQISRSKNVVLDNVVLRNAGGRSLVIAGGEKCGVQNSRIIDSGEGGVVLSGGDRSTLSRAEHFVLSSEIANFNRFGATYRPGVLMSGVGMSVVKNSIHDAGHAAIIFSGNDHLVSGNEVYRVVMESSDSGAVYVGRDFSARGSKVEGNYFHDIGWSSYSTDVKGVYLDDQASGIEVKDNIFVKVRQPVFVGGGRDNLIRNNTFIESSPAIYLDARGVLFQKKQTIDPEGELMKRLSAVPYKGLLWASRYPNLPKILDDDFGLPKYNVFCANVVIKGALAKVADEASSGIKVGGNVEVGEDALVVGSVQKSVEKKSFSIKSDFMARLSCQ